MARLRRTDCSAPGITRRRAGRGFAYFHSTGERVTEPEIIDRIRALAIPPAWTDVWICADTNGHIQAVGIDAKGRKQYRYHDRWRQRRDREKFDHMLEFARALPRLRRAADRDLHDTGLTRSRVLACGIRLLDLGFFRIGTEGYAEENETFGLATIRRRHVTVDGDLVVFDYPAKNGKRRIESVVDGDVRAVVCELKARRARGPELLAYRDGRSWRDVRSADINAYIKEASGGDYTAKDFRTWSATVLAAVALAISMSATSPSARKRAVTRAVKEVAGYLGNTAAVARSSYIDPRIVDLYYDGSTVLPAIERLHLAKDAVFGQPATQGAIERAVLALLDAGEGAARAA